MSDDMNVRDAGREDRLERLYEEALGLPEETRDAFLDRACAGDPQLRAELSSLLIEGEGAHTFMEELGHLVAPSGDAPPDRLVSALADRYRIEGRVGAGGMAVVYRARDLRHERRVALKVLNPELAAIIGGERFLAEIKTTANLQHPHILPLFDSGEADGFLYYVMPYVDGETLRMRLDRESALPVEEVVRITTQVASGLDHAHGQGIVHRDVKPANILLSGDDVWVADFGIARPLDVRRGERLTEPGESLGTPHYMSPEQIGGETRIDARTDVYSLACVVFEMLTGEPPYTGMTAASVVRQHLVADPPSAAARRVTVTGAADLALRQALAKAPADRFADAGTFARALASRLDAAERAPSQRPRVRWIAGAAVVVAVSAGAAVLLRGGGSSGVRDRSTVAVVEFRNNTGDPELDFVGEAVGRAVNDALATGLTGAEVLPFGAGAAGADYVVSGSYRRRGTSVEFLTEIEDTRGERALAAPELARADLGDPLASLETVAERALGAISYYENYFDVATASGRRPPSHEAYLAFDRGLRFNLRFQTDSAEVYLRRAIELEPGYTEAYLWLGGGVFNNQGGAASARGGMSGRWSAVDSLARAMRRTISPWTQADEGVAAYLEAEAAPDYESALRASQRLEEVLTTAGFGTGYAGVRANRPAEALAGLEPLEPDRGWLREWSPYWHFRAAALHMLERYEEELTQALRAQERFPGLQSLVLRATVATGSAEEVLRLANGVPAGPVGVVRLALEMNAHGHGDAARALVTRQRNWVRGLPPNEARGLREQLSITLPLMDELDEAIGILRELLDESPHRIDFEGRLGALLAWRGLAADVAEAEGISEKLASEDAGLLRGLPSLWRARIAARLGRRDTAVRLLERGFSEGVTPHFTHPLGEAYWHSDLHLLTLVGYEPYEALVKPPQ